MSEELYSTTDFYTAALLICCDYDVQKVTRENGGGEEDPRGRVCRFWFSESPELRQDILSFTNGKKDGSLKKFKEAIETVKDLIHS